MDIDKVLNARTRDLCGMMKELMKVFSGDSAVWSEWRIIGFKEGVVGECAGRTWKRWINIVRFA